MTLSPLGFSFRGSLPYVTDAAGQNPIINTSGYNYAASPGWGWTGGLPYSDQESTAVPAIAGYAAWTSPNTPFRIDTAAMGGAGTKYVRVGMMQAGNGSPQGLAMYDGGYYDGATSQVGQNFFRWAPSTAIGSTSKTLASIWDSTAGVYRLWKCTPSSTSAATGTTAPNGTGPTFVDGAITWTYIKTAIYSLRYTASTNGILDATGVSRPGYTDWDANNAKSGAVVVTGSFVEIVPTDQTTGHLRYFGIESASAPLQAATLKDVQGNNPTTTFTTYSGEPPNKLIKKIGAAVGAQAFTLSGTLASYFTIVTYRGEPWLAHSSTRIPFGTTGTLNIVQTDNSGSFTGSPLSTALTMTLLDAGARPTDTSLKGLLSSTCYLRDKLVADQNAANLWTGTNATTFPDGDYTVSSNTALANLLNGSTITPGAGKRFRIRLTGAGPFTGAANLTGQDFQPSTGGCLVIEPDSGFDPAIEGTWYFGTAAMKGVHIRGVKFTGAGLGGTYAEGLRFYPFNHVIAVTGNRFNAKGWVRDTSNDDWTCISIDQAISAYVVLNSQLGGGMFCNNGARYFELAYNFIRQARDDFGGGYHDFARLGEVDVYRSVHDNVCCDTYEGNIGSTHPDFWQERTTMGYPAGNLKTDEYIGSGLASKAVTVGQYMLVYPNVYKVTVAGNTPARTYSGGNWSPALPSHTSGTASDGTATLQFVMTMAAMPRAHTSIYNNLVISTGAAVNGGYQFFINSDNDHAAPVAMFNNLYAGSMLRGFMRESKVGYEDCVEFNTFVTPPTSPTGGNYSAGGSVLDPYIESGNYTGGTVGSSYLNGTAGSIVYAANNFCATPVGAVYGYGNKAVRGTNGTPNGQKLSDFFPGLGAAAGGDGIWRYTLTGMDGSTGRAALLSAASRLFHESGARSAGARLTELYPITYRAKTAGNSPSNTVSLTITVDP